jgi:hypothetical protein
MSLRRPKHFVRNLHFFMESEKAGSPSGGGAAGLDFRSSGSRFTERVREPIADAGGTWQPSTSSFASLVDVNLKIQICSLIKLCF